ncbi:MAG: M48 family metalloprotease [Burkholderiales bacterium]|nr:M48 family metalloprotease [Burkholderiales bacterium]
MRHLLIAVCLTTALLPACATVENPVTGKTERTVMDVKSEIAEGQKAHPQVLAAFGEYKDPKLQAYVNDVGQRLAKNSHRPELDWHFTVLDSPEINAFATPGGYVYITRGIMAYMQSEADLAGVVGHEIGHITGRHSSQRATRQQTAGLGVLAATILGAVLESRGLSGAAGAASQASQGVAAGYVAKYSREQELQADKLGAEYLTRINYNPQNMVDVIKLLENQERFAADQARAAGRPPQEGGSDWLASHPTSEQRLREITEIASEYKAKTKYGDDGHTRYLQATNGIPFGESSEQGVTRGQNFYHEPLGIALTAPKGWKIQNSANALALVNGEGNAAVIVQAVPPKAGDSHEEIIRNAVKPDSGRVEKRTFNGLPATHFTGTRKNQQGQSQPIELTVVTGPSNRNYAFVYAAKDHQSLQRARPQLQEAESSFRALTAADRQAARPWKLKTVAFPRGGFAELAKQSPLPSAEQQLRLLNGVYGGGDVKPGQMVKVVE